MSSILKALEKVEQERNAQHEGPLGRFQKERERRRPWIVPACVLSGAAAAALITFAAMGGFSGGKKVAASGAVAVAPAPVAAAVPAPVASVAPAATAPAPLPVEVIAPQVVQEERRMAPKVRPAPVQHAVPSVAQEVPAAAVSGGTGKRSVKKGAVAKHRLQENAEKVVSVPVALRPSEAPAPKATAPAAQVSSPGVAHSQIRVTGIAWQKDSGTSVAMINGRQVYEGEAVEGARVKEILPDKVSFTGASGTTFEVPLGAGQ